MIGHPHSVPHPAALVHLLVTITNAVAVFDGSAAAVALTLT
jgi:hypothetical protein